MPWRFQAWTRPVFLLLIFIIGGYHFLQARQRRAAAGAQTLRLPPRFAALQGTRHKRDRPGHRPGAPLFALASSEDDEGEDSDGEGGDISGIIRAIEKDLATNPMTGQ